MKSSVLKLALIVTILFITTLSSQAQIKKAFRGSWNFDAPTAPGGFNYGIYEIKKDSVLTTFTGQKFIFPSTWAKSSKDTLSFLVSINGLEVLCSFGKEDKTTMKGNAVWSSGQTIVTLKKK
jgi:hypothetical protein